MLPASTPSQRPPDARLLVADARRRLRHVARQDLARVLCPGDLLVANDAATLPASLRGQHLRTGAEIEIRLAGRRSIAADAVSEFDALVFGAGDYRTRTEDRPLPPRLSPGDELAIGPLRATVRRLLGHPRLVALQIAGTPDAIRAGIARHGRPIQYAHVGKPLALWDVWTRVASVPVAFEPPSAGFLLDWTLVNELAARRIGFATLTHAAGISSTGDTQLDARLPFDEPYLLPQSTVDAIERARANCGRVVALGTTVVRALEHAASLGRPLRAGPGTATQRIGPGTRLRVVDAIVTGTHEPGSSHYELLHAFASRAWLVRVSETLERNAYRTHEFGDSLLLERQPEMHARTARAVSALSAQPA
ncbi:MAG TPA: S-adenosylmethionine:tRNA ribosyltransferase-isomerase [Burkholderiaceae bacterium]|nr:S-adenosylmethionine:tRNA ribosyltransferase-isomerase [Burkholderiaceae bacterium]